MNLYHIPEEIMLLVDLYAHAISEEERKGLHAKIVELEGEKDEKINWIIKKVRNEMALQEAIKNEIGLLKQGLQTSENKMNRSKDFLSQFYPDYKPASCTVPFHWQKRKQVLIVDESQIPEWCYVTPEPAIPKTKLSLETIKLQIENGNEVPGAVYESVSIPCFPKKAKEDKDE